MLDLILLIALHLPPVQEEIRYLCFKAEQKIDGHKPTYPKHPEIDDLDQFLDRADRSENQWKRIP